MRIIFMGTPTFSVPSLKALLASSHKVVGVVTQPDRPKGRGHEVVFSPIKQMAEAHRLPLLQPEKINSPDFLNCLKAWEPDVIAVTAFGKILPKDILDLPIQGCVNVHGSLLPRYRGAAPIQWALINGDTETGITTMLMDKGMDTGAILLQQAVKIEPEDTLEELSERLSRIGGALLIETLRRLEEKTITPCPQDNTEATFAFLLKKEDGIINWAHSAKDLVNRIRGLSPWPGSYTFLHEERLLIWKASIAEGEVEFLDREQKPGLIVKVGKKDFRVSTGKGIVKVTEIQPVNKKRMTVESFLQGYTLTPGQILKDQTDFHK